MEKSIEVLCRKRIVAEKLDLIEKGFEASKDTFNTYKNIPKTFWIILKNETDDRIVFRQ